MFPDADHSPAGFLQTLAGVGVAGDVAVDLGAPELGVALSGPVMLRAAVPKASVDEYGDLGPREQQVGGSPDSWDRPDNDPIAEA